MRRPSRRFWKIAVPLMVILIVGLVAWKWLGSSNQAAITTNADTNQVAVPLADKTLTDRAFRLQYPGVYHVTTHTAQPPELANYVLVADTSYTKQLTVTLNSGDMNGLSAYLFRKTRNDIYSSQTVTVDGNPASLWTKSDSSEETVFIPHNGTVLTVSVSIQNSNATEGLSAEMANLIASFHWQ
jgi:hypothetical protein